MTMASATEFFGNCYLIILGNGVANVEPDKGTKGSPAAGLLSRLVMA